MGFAERVALVIGNQDYAHFRKLDNPVSDADSIRKALSDLGFGVMLIQRDVSNVAFRQALNEFRDKAKNANAAVVYYAGHGMSNDKSTFLLPVDAKVDKPEELDEQGIAVETVLDSMKDANIKLLVVDACRTGVKTRAEQAIPLDRGLGRTRASKGVSNYLIAYSAEKGQAAWDDSTYALTLAKGLGQRQKTLSEVFDEVSKAVKSKTESGQTPMLYGDLASSTHLVPPMEDTFSLSGLFQRIFSPNPLANNSAVFTPSGF